MLASTARNLLPGVALSAGTAGAGFALASALSGSLGVPVSGIPASILLGAAVRNSGLGYPDVCKPGIAFGAKTILQVGIVGVAAKLSFVELLGTGAGGLPVVAGAVSSGLVFVPAASRVAGLPLEMSYLITAGTSICGVTAITALAPAIKASNRDVAVAVANTVAFGTLGMLAYPYLFHYLCSGAGGAEQVGMCLGVAIHDTSQVLGSAASYCDAYGGDEALKAAAVTKLSRNLGLAFAIPGLTYLHAVEQARKNEAASAEKKDGGGGKQEQEPSNGAPSSFGDAISGLNTFRQYVPNFLVAFVGMSLLRSGGDLAFAAASSASAGSDATAASSAVFSSAMDFVGTDVSKCALGTAMAAVGLSTSADSLRGVGWRPFAVGASGALVVGGTGFAISTLVF